MVVASTERWSRIQVAPGKRRLSQAGIPARSRTTASNSPETSSVPHSRDRVRNRPAARRARLAAQPEQALEVDTGRSSRPWIEPVGRVNPRRQRPPPRRVGQQGECYPRAPGRGRSLDLGNLAAREAAGEPSVQGRDPGGQRPEARLAAQRRGVGLEPAGSQEVLQNGLGSGKHFRFFFAYCF